ncbi:alpha/beta fold hydrolase [Shewanella sp. WXL01]|uniref:alpha/beta fold hydrolase n=1 Tax=Shewanella sp. WXL01 TaxID=2709721 RepID=UPI00143863E8|nr:alpha/beta fold hydrolase [Shewanella sp. WXL01]NKF52558.1 alpha/beta fold hydrolase [Shewanella sp. WXL01]
MTQRFSSEHELNNQQLTDFWQQVSQQQLICRDQLKLAYAYIHHPDNNKAIVISNGRVESYIKYRELMYDLYQQGYSVYAIDHRGQGLSQRQTSNPHQGFVANFDDYVDDLELFVEQVVLPQQHEQLYLLAHSMGSAIATLLLQRQPNWFNSAVFSAPMFGIKLPVHKQFILWLARRLNRCKSQGALYHCNYVLGGSDYDAPSFADNHLTHSQLRYQDYRNTYAQTPSVQLGSPTNHWLIEAIVAADKCVEISAAIKTPRLILQASEDKIVCNSAQDASLNDMCHKVVVQGSSHEVFIESDSMRDFALNKALSFMSQHSMKAATESTA